MCLVRLKTTLVEILSKWPFFLIQLKESIAHTASLFLLSICGSADLLEHHELSQMMLYNTALISTTGAFWYLVHSSPVHFHF